jgi:hypothetical protein
LRFQRFGVAERRNNLWHELAARTHLFTKRSARGHTRNANRFALRDGALQGLLERHRLRPRGWGGGKTCERDERDCSCRDAEW